MTSSTSTLAAPREDEPAAPTEPERSPGRGADPRLLAAGVLLVVTVLALADLPLPGAVTAVLAALGTLALLGTLGGALLAAVGLRTGGPLPGALLALCLGLVTALATGLAVNELLPLVGVDRPLAPVPVALSLDLVAVGLYAVGRRRWPRRLPLPPLRLVVAPATLLLLPLAATSGAVALDNGRSPALTIVVLLLCLVLLGTVSVRGARTPLVLTAVVVYCVSLALLLMTSMRGTTITGHDVQLEHVVMNLTLESQRWDVSALESAYNTCLSITLLPGMLVALFHLPSVMVFKLVVPVLFALTPVAVLLIAHKVVGRGFAPLTATFFVAFPTFFTDMPMLNRQEIALVLLAGMILLVVHRSGADHRRRQALFVALGLGAILSHYSTTYLMLAQLSVVAVVAAVLSLARVRRLLSRVGLERSWTRRLHGGVPRIVTLGVMAPLLAAAWLWTGPITDSGGSLSSSVGRAVAALTGDGTDESSADSSASIFGAGTTTDAERLQRYEDSIPSTRAGGATSEAYYPTSVVEEYPVSVPAAERTELTGLGQVLESAGLDPYALNLAVRQRSAQVLQLLVIVGVVGLVFSRKRLRLAEPEFVLLTGAGLLSIAAFIVVPSLAVDYGLLRAFQQSFIVLTVPAVLGASAIISTLVHGARRGLRAAGRVGRTGRRVAPVVSPGARMSGLPTRATAVVPLLLFASSTGLLATATGGYLPQLHLANAGENYDSYYTPDTEVAAAQWLVARPDLVPGWGGNAQADLWDTAKVYSQTGVEIDPGILPAAVRTDSYVLLGRTNVVLLQGKDGLNNQPVGYTLPLEFFATHKNLVYSTGDTEVYR